MTVQYAGDIGESSIWSNIKVLLRWKGSVWKDIYKEFLIWCLLYIIIAITLHSTLNDDQKIIFDKISYTIMKYDSFIPLTFMLGFYVTNVVTRWVAIIDNLSFIDAFSIYCTEYISGMDIRSKFMRRSILRYMTATQVLVFRDISPKVRKRFPELKSLKEEGYLTEDELEKLTITTSNTLAPWWIPTLWAMNLVDCLRVLMTFRGTLNNLLIYDWFPIPLAYTQIVSIAVRSYFLFCLVSRQIGLTSEYNDKKNMSIYMYVPIFTVFQFIFYVGWLKLAETLINPLGNDDDDIDVSFVINRNLSAGLGIVDKDLEYRAKIAPDIMYKKFK